MSKERIYELFDRHDNLTLEAMQAFLRGELNEKQTELVKARLAVSPMDADALMGLKEMQDAEQAAPIVAGLNERIEAAAEKKKMPAGIYVNLYRYSAVAAVVLVLMVGAWMFMNIGVNNEFAMVSEEDNNTSEMAERARDMNYKWSESPSDGEAVDLSQDTYIVSVTDANGCDTVQLDVAGNMTTTYTANAFANSPGASDGSINLTVTGGTQPYTYAWDSGQTLNNATISGVTGVNAGTYSITVTDAYGASFSPMDSTGDDQIALVQPHYDKNDGWLPAGYKAPPSSVASGEVSVDEVVADEEEKAGGTFAKPGGASDSISWAVNDYSFGDNEGVRSTNSVPVNSATDLQLDGSTDKDQLALLKEKSVDKATEAEEDYWVEEEMNEPLEEDARNQEDIETLIDKKVANVQQGSDKATATKGKAKAESGKFISMSDAPVAAEVEEVEEESSPEIIFTQPEVKPQYPGGEQALEAYMKNLKLPASQKDLKWIVLTELVINEQGDAEQVTILEGLNPQVDAAVKKHLEAMPAWQPGQVGGSPVKVQMKLPVKIGM